MLFSLVYGVLADKIAGIRYLSFWCGFIYTLGNLTYANLSVVPRSTNMFVQARFFAMIMSRLMVGSGTGNHNYSVVICICERKDIVCSLRDIKSILCCKDNIA